MFRRLIENLFIPTCWKNYSICLVANKHDIDPMYIYIIYVLIQTNVSVYNEILNITKFNEILKKSSEKIIVM